MTNLTLGFPRMHVEPGEKRDFTPSFFNRLSVFPEVTFLLETGYGSSLGYNQIDYIAHCGNLRFVSYHEVMAADLVTIIRTPPAEDLMKMKKGSILFSMLHYPTHAVRNQLLKNHQIRGISMDSLTDDYHHRYIQDYDGTAKNAMKQAFELWKSLNCNSLAEIVQVTILGTGGLGRIATDIAVHHGGVNFPWNPPVIVKSLGRNATSNSTLVKEILKETDILVDTTLRRNTQHAIIKNTWLRKLPEHAVIVDISADDYDTQMKPVQVKAIEGIPTGTLDQTIFMPNDEAWDSVPDIVSNKHRRPVVSCYSWPGADPVTCLEKYENQMFPFMELMIRNFDLRFSPNSNNPFERAMVRASLAHYLTGYVQNNHP